MPLPNNAWWTVNSKATVSERVSRTDRDGNLRPPRMAKGQNKPEYTTVRGGLPSPVDGEVDGQLLKVDLVTMRAQLFYFDDRRRAHPSGPVEDIADDVVAVLQKFPQGSPPPPSAFDVDEL